MKGLCRRYRVISSDDHLVVAKSVTPIDSFSSIDNQVPDLLHQIFYNLLEKSIIQARYLFRNWFSYHFENLIFQHFLGASQCPPNQLLQAQGHLLKEAKEGTERGVESMAK